MPILDNPRHERFAQELARGKSASQAYELAGFKPDRGNASKLHQEHSILQRVGELIDKREKVDLAATERVVEKLAITKEWVIEQLVENAQLAKASEDYGPANKAIELLGKELGMFIERKEVGKPGEFADMTLEQKRERAIALARQLGLNRISPTAGSA